MEIHWCKEEKQMNTIELIQHRKSVRTFSGEAFRAQDKEKLDAFAKEIENPYGLKIEYRILDAKQYGLSSPVLTGEDTYIGGKIRRAPHAEEAFGYSFEKLLLYADSLGIGSVMIGGTMDRKHFEQVMELQEGEVLPCVSPLGYPAKKRSLKETMMRKGIKADTRLPFEELFFDGNFDTPLGQEKLPMLQEALEMVRWAPSAVNKQPWRVVVDGSNVHFYEQKSKGYTDATGWDMQKIDMGIALCHFEMGLEDKGCKAKFVISDPGIAKPEDVEYIATYQLQ